MLAPSPKLPNQSVARTARTRHVTHNGLTWIDIANPGAEEIAFLRQHYSFHPLNLDDCLSKTQRPKLDSYPDAGYLFVVLHFPRFDADERVATVEEVDVFVGKNFVITIHSGKLKPLVRLLNIASVDEKARTQLLGRSSGYTLYRLLDALVRHCFPMLDQVDMRLDEIETMLFGRNVRATVQEISTVRRDIIALRRIVRPNLPILHLLEQHDLPFLDVDEETYFGDLTDGMGKIADVLEEYNEVIISYNATVDSLTSHRINEIMKILTVISTVVLPMTLVASIYGMNVPLPLAEHPWSFGVTVALMILSAVGMLTYFRYNDWI